MKRLAPGGPSFNNENRGAGETRRNETGRSERLGANFGKNGKSGTVSALISGVRNWGAGEQQRDAGGCGAKQQTRR